MKRMAEREENREGGGEELEQAIREGEENIIDQDRGEKSME